jgi:hypothetical protein
VERDPEALEQILRYKQLASWFGSFNDELIAKRSATVRFGIAAFRLASIDSSPDQNCMPSRRVRFKNKLISREAEGPDLFLSDPIWEPAALNVVYDDPSSRINGKRTPISDVIPPSMVGFIRGRLKRIRTREKSKRGGHQLCGHLPVFHIDYAANRMITEWLRYSPRRKP